MQKGTCHNCGHTIQQTHTDRCMICGEPLPEAQRFSALEKEAIDAQRSKVEQERLEARQRLGGGGSGGYGDGGGGCWDGGDCGGGE